MPFFINNFPGLHTQFKQPVKFGKVDFHVPV